MIAQTYCRSLKICTARQNELKLTEITMLNFEDDHLKCHCDVGNVGNVGSKFVILMYAIYRVFSMHGILILCAVFIYIYSK